MSQQWADKVVFITGAAAGIGLAAARLLARDGASVALVDRDARALAAAVEDTHASRVVALEADVSSEADVTAAIARTLELYGRIDGAVVNAGIAGANMPLEEYPVELFDEVVATNLRGAWLTLRAVVKPMKAARSGSIVLTSSIQGLAALAGTTAYTTTKHAVVGMMKGAALELAQFGVRVNTIHPGYVDTPMMQACLLYTSDAADESSSG